jgi:hypothetical protein
MVTGISEPGKDTKADLDQRYAWAKQDLDIMLADGKITQEEYDDHLAKLDADYLEDSKKFATSSMPASEGVEAEDSPFSKAAESEALTGQLASAATDVTAAMERSTPAIRTALRQGVGATESRGMGVLGRGGVRSGADMRRLGQTSAAVRSEAAGRLADLDIDTAAQRVEEVAFRKDLLEADIRKTKESFGSIWQELDTVIKAVAGTKPEDNARRKEQGLGRLNALRTQYFQAGDMKAVGYIDSLIGQLEASSTGYIVAIPTPS